jgi:DNA excision repair protein ERCC-3
VIEYIRSCTYTFGKAKIVLKDNRFFIESRHQDILRELLKNPVIRNARVEIPAPSLDPVSDPINGGGGGGRNNPAALDSVTQHTGA